MADQVRWEDPSRYYEALGRIMSALRGSGVLNGARYIDWWPGSGGFTWKIEWQGGPTAAEAAEIVLRLDENDPAGCALRGVVRWGEEGNQHNAHLVVLDVPVALRALAPLGVREVIRRIGRRHSNASSRRAARRRRRPAPRCPPPRVARLAAGK
ncbi:hypothetical protein [Micromonospora sediminicola]|uniref:hypothetical protein n=1 Tax=Micromonospora sediminicola TaxID=946078 RepID=UPI00379B7B8A